MKRKLVFVLLLAFFGIRAQINYVDVNPDFSSSIVLGGSDSGLSTVSLPGGNSFSFRWDSYSSTEWFYHIEGNGVQFVLVSGLQNSYGKDYVQIIDSGTGISNTSNFDTSSNNDPLITDGENLNFKGQGDKYIGFRFQNSGQFYYGWILVNFSGDTFTMKEYAYENSVNTAINAGDKGALSIENYIISNEKNRLVVFPVPVKNELNIHIDGKLTDELYVVYDLYGKKVQEGKVDSGKIYIEDIVQGFYFLNVGQQFLKFVKE